LSGRQVEWKAEAVDGCKQMRQKVDLVITKKSEVVTAKVLDKGITKKWCLASGVETGFAGKRIEGELLS